MKNEMVETAVAALIDRKADAVKSLFVGESAGITEYFVLATGDSRPQLNALTDAVEEAMNMAGYIMKGREGRAEGGWILLDYGEIVVQIFSREMREFYNLDHTWKDVPSESFC